MPLFERAQVGHLTPGRLGLRRPLKPPRRPRREPLQVFKPDHAVAAEGGGAFQEVLELADVPGIVVSEEGRESLSVDSRDLPAFAGRETLEEVFLDVVRGRGEAREAAQ